MTIGPELDSGPMDARHLERVVVAETGTGAEAYRGRVVSYADQPTYNIETTDGEHVSWLAHLCRPATRDEEFAYWRERAERAEAELGSSALTDPEEEG